MNYALLCSCERSEAKELPFMSAFFLWERKGYYLRSVAPSSPKPSLTPLHVISCCAMRRFKFDAYASFVLNLHFKGAGLGESNLQI